MKDFCASSEFDDLRADTANECTPGTRKYCCKKLNRLFGELVENCLPGAGSYKSLGAARLPLGPVATPEPPRPCDACSFRTESGFCRSACPGNRFGCAERNGKAFCVRCDDFLLRFPDGVTRDCCELRPSNSGPLCRPTRTIRGETFKCFTNEGPWRNQRGHVRKEQPYTIDAVQNVCNAKKNFWVNRGLCKVTEKANGTKKCTFISDERRDKILMGR